MVRIFIMIIVLSPAKTLDYGVDPKSNHTAPQFLSQSSNLIKTLKEKEPKDIASLMGLSSIKTIKINGW